MIAMHDEVHHHLCKSYRSGKFADSWMDFNADQLNTRRRDADGSELDNAKEVKKKTREGRGETAQWQLHSLSSNFS